MISLKNSTPFAKGSRRQCYVYQEDDQKCIKVILPERPPELIRQQSKFYKKIRSATHFDENLNEVKGQQYIPFYEHFPVCFDTVPTDLGIGLVVELIRNDDGTIARTVADIMEERALSEDENKALKQFFDYLMKHAIIVRDLTQHNVVLQHKDNKIKAYMVDGFGNSDLLPFVRYSTRLARSKILRKTQRTFNFLNYQWHQTTQSF